MREKTEQRPEWPTFWSLHRSDTVQREAFERTRNPLLVVERYRAARAAEEPLPAWVLDAVSDGMGMLAAMYQDDGRPETKGRKGRHAPRLFRDLGFGTGTGRNTAFADLRELVTDVMVFATYGKGDLLAPLPTFHRDDADEVTQHGFVNKTLERTYKKGHEAYASIVRRIESQLGREALRELASAIDKLEPHPALVAGVQRSAAVIDAAIDALLRTKAATKYGEKRSLARTAAQEAKRRSNAPAQVRQPASRKKRPRRDS